MKEIEIDAQYYFDLAANGSVSFPHIVDGNRGLKAGEPVWLHTGYSDDAPLDRPIEVTITQISAPITIGACQVCAISVERASAASLGGRLAQTLMGHHYELLAAFARSGAHKLPGSKGRLRENALARFLQVWIPRRFACPSNVFLTHETAGNFEREIDLAAYDSVEGPIWPLDGEDENSFLAYRHTKAVFEVKSTLDPETLGDALKSMQAFDDYMREVENSDPEPGNATLVRPIKILFAYRIDEKFARGDFLQHLVDGPDPFDLIVVLGTGAYFANRLLDMAIAFQRKLTIDEARNDLDAINSSMAHEFSGRTFRYMRTTTAPDDTLMALVYALTDRCAGSDLTSALLSALSVKSSVIPLDLPEPGDSERGFAASVPGDGAPADLDDFRELCDFLNSDDPSTAAGLEAAAGLPADGDAPALGSEPLQNG